MAIFEKFQSKPDFQHLDPEVSRPGISIYKSLGPRVLSRSGKAQVEDSPTSNRRGEEQVFKVCRSVKMSNYVCRVAK